MLKERKKTLTFKWTALLALLTFILLTITCLSILQVYPEDLKRSFIEVRGVVLIIGIPFSLFLIRKFDPPTKRSSKEKEQELVQRTRELETVYELGTLINQNLGDLNVVLPVILEKVTTLTGYEMGAIFLLNEMGDVLEMKSQIGHSPALLQEVKVLRLNEGVSGKAIRLKQPVIVSISEYPSPRIVPILREEGVQTVVGIPLLARGKAIGAIILSSRSPCQLSQKEVNSLQSVGNHIGIALENSVLLNEIRESEERYRTVVENAIDSVCVIGRDHIFKYVNERLAEIRGCRKEELIGTDFRNLLDDESRTLLADREDKRARGIKLPSHFELNIFHKGGGVRNAEISASAIKDSKGDVNIIVFLKDITERKQAEEALRESGERMKSISRAAPIGIGVVTNRVLMDVNARICEMTGYSREELVGSSARIVYPTQDDFDYVGKEKYGQIAEKGTGSVETRWMKKDGAIIDVLLSSTPIDLSDLSRGVTFTALDITERKRAEEALRESEERFRLAFENANTGVCLVDLEGNLTRVNNKMCEIFGYTKEEFERMTVNGIAHPEDIDESPSFIQKTLRGEMDRGTFEKRYFHKKGHVVTCQISSSLVRDAKGLPLYFISHVHDITERKKMEKALREREERYRTLLETMEEGYYEVDLKGRFTFFNEALRKMHALSRVEMLGMSNRQYMDEATANKVYKIFNQVYKTGQPGKIFEWEITRSDDKKAVVESSVYLIRNAQGVPFGFRGITRDITERKRMEDALRESENKFRSLVEHSIVGVYLIQNGVFKYVNSRVAEIHGYEIEEMVGKMGPKQSTLPEDLSIVEGNIGKRMKGEGGSIQYEFRIVTKSQEIRYVEVFGSRTMYQGRPAVIGTMLDITDRKKAEEALRQSEERYRNILESIEDGYYEVDLTGNLTFFNDSLRRIYGYPKEELIGMNDRQLTDQGSAKRLFQTYNKVYRTGEPGKVFDWEIIRKDGTRGHVEASVSLQKDASGKAIGFRGILRDITEKKKVEEQLFQAEKLRAVGEMASGVAHDFNNALAAILGNTQLLLHTAHDEEIKETLKIIEKVAKDSGHTVRRLQDFTRKRVGQELFRVDVNAIIEDSMEMTKPKWKDEPQGRGIRIEVVSNLQEIPSVSGNASELREVITNMIFNAIEAMPEGGKIEIRTFKKRRDVLIQISDTGIGIAEEMKKRIFEPFFTTKPFTNTGLGLSMSYGIIRRFGGEIEVESQLGQGTTFTIILPVGGEEKEETVSPKAIKKGGKACILVIDDDEFVRSVLSRTLAQANHQVTLAESGEKGVQIFREGKFDIVLTDLGLPGMSGWEVCRMIKETSPQTPVGMITGWGVEKNHSEMEEYGLDFFVSKPFDFNQILNVVSETMASKEE